MRLYCGLIAVVTSLLLEVAEGSDSLEGHHSFHEDIGHCRAEAVGFDSGHEADSEIHQNSSQIAIGDEQERCEEVADSPPTIYDIKSIPGKGLGLVAARFIPQGTHILVEEPYFYVPMPVFHEGQGFRITDMLTDLEQAFSTLSSFQQEEVLQLHDHRFPSEENQSSLLTIFRSNAYNTGEKHIGLFPKSARINHSCKPNAGNFWSEKTSRRVIYALRDIEEGSEIMDSYIPLLKSIKQRQERLQQYGFTCTCSACQSSESSKRRVKIADSLESLEQKIRSPGKKEIQQKRIKKALSLIDMIEEEELTEYLPRAFHIAAVFLKQNGDLKGARKWAMKELEIHQWSELDSNEALLAIEFIDSLDFEE